MVGELETAPQPPCFGFGVGHRNRSNDVYVHLGATREKVLTLLARIGGNRW
jgi:hypothetical protein